MSTYLRLPTTTRAFLATALALLLFPLTAGSGEPDNKTRFDEETLGHWAEAFTCLLAGAGVKGGVTYGETDEYGIHIANDPCHVHDYHATILHLMGIDHEELTYRYAGRDVRLADVYGKVIKDILT